jgi:3-oxoacyl-[acyl-carrier-protein] synthase-3
MGNSIILGVGKYNAKYKVTNNDLSKYILNNFSALLRQRIHYDKLIGINSRNWESWHPNQKGKESLLKRYPSNSKNIFSNSWHFIHDELKLGKINTEKLHDSGMAYFAAKDAIKSADIHPEDIEVVIYCSSTPDLLIQQQSGKIAEALGIRGAFVQDIIAGCTGFFDGLYFADKLIKSGEVKTVLVTGSNMISNYARWYFNAKGNDSKISYGHPGWYSAVIFGDGAGAAVLTKGKNNDTGFIYSFGEYEAEDNPAVLAAGGSAVGITHETLDKCLEQFYVHHGLVKKNASTLMERAFDGVIRKCRVAGKGNFDLDDFDYFIPHQPSVGVLKESAEKIGVEKNKMLDELENYGNMVCANIPVIITNNASCFDKGTLLMFLVIGGGCKFGATIYKCGDEFEKMMKRQERV